MPSEPSALLIVGLLILCGYGGGRLVGLLRLPAVTGYIIVGLALGISGAAIVGDAWWHSLEWTVEFALSLVAFNVGYELRFAELARLGKGLTLLVVLETIGAFVAIWGVMSVVGLGWRLGMLIGAIGAATAPAVTVIVFNSLRAKGPLTQAVLACVGFDDALGLIIYSVVAPLLAAHGAANGAVALKVLYQLGLSIGVGCCLGVLAVIVTRYIKHEAELMVAIVGIVVFCAGLLESRPFGLHCSPLLGAMMVGFLAGNFGRAMRRFGETFFAAASPFYTLYFALAGSRTRLSWCAARRKVARRLHWRQTWAPATCRHTPYGSLPLLTSRYSNRFDGLCGKRFSAMGANSGGGYAGNDGGDGDSGTGVDEVCGEEGGRGARRLTLPPVADVLLSNTPPPGKMSVLLWEIPNA